MTPEPSAPDPSVAAPSPRRASRRRRAGSLVLTMEIVVVFFFTLAAFGLQLVDRGTVFLIGLVAVVVIVCAIGLLARSVGYALGWMIQGGLICLGLVHPVMYVVGGIFAAMWVYAMVVGRRADAMAISAEGQV